MTADPELEYKLEKVRAQHEAEKKIVEFLQLPEDTRYSVCRHDSKDSAGHWSVTVSSAATWGGLPLAKALEILEQHLPQIMDVEFHKEPSTCKVWMPTAINYSAAKHGAEYQGLAQVEIEQTGGVGFTSRKISYWIQHPTLSYIDVGLNIGELPKDWSASAHYGAFSRDNGNPTQVTFKKPTALSGDSRQGFGGSGSWDHRSYLTCAMQLLNELKPLQHND
jgi:hypothetical protein